MDQETLRFIFGLKIRGLRLDKGLSLKELSRNTGLSPSYLNEIEKGKKYPKQEKIVQLAQALGSTHEDLVSIKLKKELFLINQLVEKNILSGLPFDVFGIPANTIFELFAERPKKMGALIGTLLELARVHDISIDDFYFATLRSYINMHQNFFPGVEEKADRFRQDFEITIPRNAESAVPILSKVLTADFKVLVKNFTDDSEFAKDLLYFIRQDSQGQKILAIREGLDPKEVCLILAREIGFQYLRVKTRPRSSMITQLDSFEQLFNHFSASYFASALLVDREETKIRLTAIMKSPSFPALLWNDLFHAFPAPVESLFYRMAQLLPKYFDLDQIYLLRTEQSAGDPEFEIVRELHLTSLHSPHSVRRGESYCRRWVTARLLKESSATSLESQTSYFSQTGQEYLNVATAYEISHGKRVCMTLGLSMTPALKASFHWLTDVPRKEVGSTCERCRVKDCAERAAAFRPSLDPARHGHVEERVRNIELLD